MVNSKAEYLFKILEDRQIHTFDLDKPFTKQMMKTFKMVSFYNGFVDTLKEETIISFLKMMFEEMVNKRYDFRDTEEENRIFDYAKLFVCWQLDLPYRLGDSNSKRRFAEYIKMVSSAAFNAFAIASIVVVTIVFIFKAFG